MKLQAAVLGGMVVTRVNVLHRLSPKRIWGKLKQLLTTKPITEECAAPPVATTAGVAEEKDVVKDTAHPSATCYPNPASDKITVSLPGPTIERLISLNSLQGQVIEERVSNQSEEQLDVAGLPAGIYLVKIEGMDGNRLIRIVKR
jgi:hypothetical protein